MSAPIPLLAAAISWLLLAGCVAAPVTPSSLSRMLRDEEIRTIALEPSSGTDTRSGDVTHEGRSVWWWIDHHETLQG